MADRTAPPLVLDAMLGKLARWLRLMGYDARFIRDTDDLVLIRVARAEGRVLLTRDGPLAACQEVETLFITSTDYREQIEQVKAALGEPPEPVTPRCGVCNTPLENLPPEEAEGRVPPYVWRTQTAFTHCTGCRRVYWRGSHWEGIEERLAADDDGE